MTKVGFGYDIHRLVSGRDLFLGGVKVPHAKGLLGHSDGDVILHAVGDAVLGALGEGEIGQYFPPSDPEIKGIPSSKIMEKVLEKLRDKEGRILHLDVTLVAEEPRLASFYPKLKASLCKIMKLPAERINIKAKSQEGLGEIGQGQAIACYAVASIVSAQ
ncbi:MAG: 2-C-methyl-D-erythritol 2,4-cyclodiphosphate synthase [Elusimicrobia bacterium]|nr:2-C-methyl-D-erythritol 2,4-cyclodiphosphate synthase [Elusimicrobiota bacterium]